MNSFCTGQTTVLLGAFRGRTFTHEYGEPELRESSFLSSALSRSAHASGKNLCGVFCMAWYESARWRNCDEIIQGFLASDATCDGASELDESAMRTTWYLERGMWVHGILRRMDKFWSPWTRLADVGAIERRWTREAKLRACAMLAIEARQGGLS